MCHNTLLYVVLSNVTYYWSCSCNTLASQHNMIMYYCSSHCCCTGVALHATGYVLDCLPSPSSEWKSVAEQVKYVTNLENRPDVIINLKVLHMHVHYALNMYM